MCKQPATFSAPAPSQRLRPPAFVRTVLVLGLIALGLLSASRSPGQGAEKGPKAFHVDFRGGRPIDEEILKYTDPTARALMKVEAEGLRISTPGSRPNNPPGIAANFRVAGDCEITTSYELLKAQQPATSSGCGVSLYIMTPSKEAVMIANYFRIDGHSYSCDRNSTDATGSRQFQRKQFPTEARAGRLRLVRRGTIVSCLVAEEGKSEFRELQQYELGTENIRLVRVAAHSGDVNAPVEVRIRDFEIRPLTVPLDVPVSLPEEPAKAEGKQWLLVVVGLGGFLALLIGLAAFLYRRQRRSTLQAARGDSEEDVPVEPETAAEVVSFACPDCGKLLKVRAALAGKRVKCSRCGVPAFVPSVRADEAG